MDKDLNQITTKIEELFTQEKRVPAGRDGLEAKMRFRKEIEQGIAEIENVSYKLTRRIHALPQLPIEELMDWAEAALAMENLAILVLDTTSLSPRADIIRFYAIDGRGDPILDVVINPQRERNPNTAYTGISQADIDDAPSLAATWHRIQKVLRGRFVISYGSDFVESRLDNNIEHYELARLPLIGDCLMEKAKSYFQIGSYGGIKLTEACLRIGHQMPNPPLAPDRAQGQLALLRAMSQGITSVATTPAPETITINMSVEEEPF